MRHPGAANGRKGSISCPSSFTQCACQTSSPVQPRSSAYCPGRQPNLWPANTQHPRRSRPGGCASSHPLSRARYGRVAHQVAADTENGLHGATPTRTIAPGLGSWNASITRMLSFQDRSVRLRPSASGGKTAVAFADAHRAACRVEAQADLVCAAAIVSSSRAPLG